MPPCVAICGPYVLEPLLLYSRQLGATLFLCCADDDHFVLGTQP